MPTDEIVLQAANWTVMEVGEPFEGALHHWRLIPHRAALDGLVGLSFTQQDEIWHVLDWLKARYHLTYWSMASRSWEGGVVHVVVGDPSSERKVVFEMGPAPDNSESDTAKSD